jgi:hypothetical protein
MLLGILFCQGPGSGVRAAEINVDSEGLGLNVELPQTEFLLQEPLLVTVRVINMRPYPVVIPAHLGTDMGLIKYEISDLATGEKVGYKPTCYIWFDWGGYRGTEIQPGGSYSHQEDLGFTATAREGTYSVEAFYEWHDARFDVPLVRSSVAGVFKVRAPTGVDAEAFRLLQKINGYGGSVWSLRPEYLGIYDQVLRDYPGSRYAKWAEVWMALYWTCREGRRDEAIAAWRRVLTDYPPFGYTGFALLQLMDIYYGNIEFHRKQRDLEAARRVALEILGSPLVADNHKERARYFLEDLEAGRLK